VRKIGCLQRGIGAARRTRSPEGANDPKRAHSAAASGGTERPTLSEKRLRTSILDVRAKGDLLSGISIDRIVHEIDVIHRELAKITLGRILGTPSALGSKDVLETHGLPLGAGSIDTIRAAIREAGTEEESERLERIFYGCIDLAIEEEIASLDDMLIFYMRRGFMHVGSEKIPALDVVPWLQAQPDFDKREEMRKENSIFLKGLVNPMLTAIVEVTTGVVTRRFGFKNYAEYAERKKQVSFNDQVHYFRGYLSGTEERYRSRITPWIEEKIGRPLDNLSRYHGLYLVRIRRFDAHFPVSRLREIVGRSFEGLGFHLASRSDVVLEISADHAKTPDGICLGVEIPGEIHVLTKPVGGLIDVETLLHELGHAFFLAHFDPDLPVEYRRLYRSGALDEAFAFLFMDLLDNRTWIREVAGLSESQADELIKLTRTKRLCLIRRYIGKFLAEKEFHENGNLKDSAPYARYLKEATGFTYEPEGYLVDMERDFYALDYLRAWAGAHVLRTWLEDRFTERWFTRGDAGEFLKQIASQGRRQSLEEVIVSSCGEPPRLPDFAGD
jgi:hypothetical protein